MPELEQQRFLAALKKLMENKDGPWGVYLYTNMCMYIHTHISMCVYVCFHTTTYRHMPYMIAINTIQKSRV